MRHFWRASTFKILLKTIIDVAADQSYNTTAGFRHFRNTKIAELLNSQSDLSSNLMSLWFCQVVCVAFDHFRLLSHLLGICLLPFYGLAADLLKPEEYFRFCAQNFYNTWKCQVVWDDSGAFELLKLYEWCGRHKQQLGSNLRFLSHIKKVDLWLDNHKVWAWLLVVMWIVCILFVLFFY